MSRVRALAVFVAIATVACTTKDNTTTNNNPTTNPPPNEVNKTYTLQGFVADATTGARIGGDLQLFLIQGVDVRTPTRLNGGATDPLLGEFAFAGIPIDYNSGNKTYKIVAVKPGYQRFEAEITDTVVLTARTVAGTTQLDTLYNVVGNIYLFPLAATVPSYEFTVQYNGQPVPGATVVLDPAPNANNPLYNTYHALTSTATQTGYAPSLTATTNAQGVATFDGAQLVLGGAYQAQVLPVKFTEAAGTSVQLARYDGGAAIVAGLDNVHETIVMDDLIWDNLYVVSTSNDTYLGATASTISPTGALVINFSAPVYLRAGTSGFGATLSAGSGGVLGTPATSATLSPDGRTLTLMPSFTTAPTAANGVQVTYDNGTAFVEPRDYPGATRLVFGAGGLTYVGNAAKHVNAAVWMSQP